MAVRVLSIELTKGITDLTDLENYDYALVLVRNRAVPLGCVLVTCKNGRVQAARLQAVIGHDQTIQRQLTRLSLRHWFDQPEQPTEAGGPSCSVVICTRNRPDDLARCLASLCPTLPPQAEIVVVDNAPSDDRSAKVAALYPVRYVVEPTQGLNWARRCGSRLATGEILIFTDDDVVVDPGWVEALRQPFVDQSVAISTGLILPAELETPSQQLFERYFSFSRGFERRDFSLATIKPLDTHRLGVGASMALRRELVNALDLFKPELGVGTPAQAGEESYAFYHLLNRGYRAVYTPAALAWHYHRRTPQALAKTLYGYNVGYHCVLLRCILEDHDSQALDLLWWMLRDRLWWSLLPGQQRRPATPPLKLALLETRGALAAPWAYWRSRRRERRLENLPFSGA